MDDRVTSSDSFVVEIDSPFVSDTARRGAPRRHEDDVPFVHAADLGVTRGYGAFEVVHGVGDRLIAFHSHLRRLEESCGKLLLPHIRYESWIAATKLLLNDAAPAGEFAIRFIVTAGGPYDHRAWLRYEPVSTGSIDARTRLRSVKSFDRGIAIGESREKPWLLHGVKSLSYGANLLTEKFALEAGFDDAVFVSSDGFLLEGTTSSVVGLQGDRLITTPLDQGILPGTTQQLLYGIADRLGLETAYRRIRVSEVGALDGLWLMSAVRLVTGVNRFDEVRLSASLDLTADLNSLLLNAAEAPADMDFES